MNTINFNFKRTKSIIAACVLASSFATSAGEMERQRYQLTHEKQVAKIDGVMNESAWKNATKMELKYENNPGEGVPAVVKTEIYFYENGSSLNVAIKAYDPNPEDIRSSLRDRDALWADDNVGIIIDTFNDERSGYEFFV